MTLKQINELHDLCFHINMLAISKKDAPVVTYSMRADNMFPPIIYIIVRNSKTLKKILNFIVDTEEPINKEYRKNLKALNDIKKRLEEKEDE